VDGFEPVGLTLAVVTEDNVEARSPKDFAAQVSKIVYFKSVEDHRQDFSIRLCDPTLSSQNDTGAV
jgi:hypothetical protein